MEFTINHLSHMSTVSPFYFSEAPFVSTRKKKRTPTRRYYRSSNSPSSILVIRDYWQMYLCPDGECLEYTESIIN